MTSPRTHIKLAGACLILVAVAWGAAPAAIAAEPISVDVQVSPHTLALHARMDCFTVHAAIPLSTVEVTTLVLNGLRPTAVGADLRGDLVCKFDPAAVKQIVAPPTATFVLSGTTKDGVPFSGADTIRVVP